MNFFNSVNTHFTAVLAFSNYHPQKQSQLYGTQILGKLAKCANKMNVSKETAVLKPSDTISVVSSLDNFMTACNSNSVHEGTAIKLFPDLIREPAKQVCYTE